MITKRLGVEHLGYRILALLITLILWVTVVSQKEIVSTQTVLVQFLVPSEYQIQGANELNVRVQIEGPRPIVKRFFDKHWPSNIVIPIREPRVGTNTVEILVSYLQLPTEIKVLSISPREVVLQVVKSP